MGRTRHGLNGPGPQLQRQERGSRQRRRGSARQAADRLLQEPQQLAAAEVVGRRFSWGSVYLLAPLGICFWALVLLGLLFGEQAEASAGGQVLLGSWVRVGECAAQLRTGVTGESIFLGYPRQVSGLFKNAALTGYRSPLGETWLPSGPFLTSWRRFPGQCRIVGAHPLNTSGFPGCFASA